MPIINDDYVAGFLDCRGAITVSIPKKHTKNFRFVITILEKKKEKIIHTEKVLNYLQEKYNVIYKTFKNKGRLIFFISEYEALKKIYEFIEKNCVLKDYKNYKEFKCYMENKEWRRT
jgi:hypothetical protein